MKQILDLFLTFCRIGAFTFGGGYAMISLLDHECVEKKRWLTSDELMNVTVIAESTPGPIAINCATYTGYKVAGWKGTIAATVGIVLPSFLLVLLISGFFENVLAVSMISKAFRGIRIAVSILIMRAGIKMIKNLVKKSPHKRVQIPMIAFFFCLVLVLQTASIHISTLYFILGSGLAGFLLFQNPKMKKARGDKP